jgi:hypothetical protein
VTGHSSCLWTRKAIIIIIIIIIIDILPFIHSASGITEADLAEIGIPSKLLRRSILSAFADLIEAKKGLYLPCVPRRVMPFRAAVSPADG